MSTLRLYSRKLAIFSLGLSLTTCFFVQPAPGQALKDKKKEISRAFELRHFTSSDKANGETDFKGQTAIFDTQMRIRFLQDYANYATRFFNDHQLDKLVVEKAELNNIVKNIKPQPLPTVRQRIPLDTWKYYGYRQGQHEEQNKALQKWNERPGVALTNGELLFTENPATVIMQVDNQDWRMRMAWKAFIPSGALPVSFSWDGVWKCGVDKDGYFYYNTNGKIIKNGKATLNDWTEFVVETDLETGKCNWWANGKLLVDFSPLSNRASAINTWAVVAGEGFRLDNIWGTTYRKTYDPDGDHNTRDVPFSIDTFIDQDFETKPDIDNWQFNDFNDSHWPKVPRWPYAHGGERHKGESLYLRTTVKPENYELATLRIETISPSGEVWINGEIVHVQHTQHPFDIDVTRFLRPEADNLIAVRVNPNKVQFTNRHTPADLYTGWFTGRMWL